jgi:intracellular septation protein
MNPKNLKASSPTNFDNQPVPKLHLHASGHGPPLARERKNGVSAAMTDPTPPNPPAKAGANQLLIDLGPVAVFVLSFNLLQRFEATKENAVYFATGIFIAATLAAIAYCKLKLGRIPPVLIVTGVLITAFGGLTLALHNETFIKVKPTFVYLFYAGAIGVSVLMRQNIWKLLFGHVFTLPDRIWSVLALRWAGFFVFQALLNEYIRHSYSTEFWVNSRLWLVFPLVMLFALANTPLVLKYNAEDPPESSA